MSKEITRTLALAALAAIVEKESKIDLLAAEVKAQREKLDELMISLKQVRLEGGECEAIRYPSTGYKIDEEALEKFLRRQQDIEVLETLMPRGAAVAKVREVIDGKLYPALTKKVRACATQKKEWKLKVQKIKRKAVAVSEAACAAG